MRPRVIFVVLAAVGCGSGGAGPAVDVTVRADASLSRVIAQIKTLDVAVTGAETFHHQYPLTSQLTTGQARFVYQPGVRSGALTFSVSGLDGAGATLGFGQGSVGISGGTTPLVVTLDSHVPTGGPDMTTCASPCTSAGATRCAGTQVQTCTLAGGCLSWSAAADCAAGQVCLDATQACGCTIASCAAQKLGCDATTGQCAACSAPPAGAADFYADVTSFAGGTGTQSCPFPTITAAIGAADASSAGTRTIHVAAGTYDAASGEAFPLVLRKLSLVGAGADKTIISGIGAFDHTARCGQFDSPVSAAIVVGDTNVPSSLSAVQVRAPMDTVTANYFGVFCDEGNAPDATGTPVSPFPAPSLTITDSTLGPGFALGLVVTTSNNVPGCNASVTKSAFIAGGIWALGCGNNPPCATPMTQWVAAQIGDDNGGGNTFTQIADSTNGRTAITLWDCASPGYIQGNTIDGANQGIVVANHGQTDYVVVENNKLTNLTAIGLQMTPLGNVVRLVGNLFSNISAGAAGSSPAVAILLGDAATTGAHRPNINRARGNTFVGNDIAIEWTGSAPFANDTVTTDFGTAGDPGMNVFRCNSAPTGALFSGYDLYVGNTATSGQAQPTFAGNQWDHAPLQTATGGSTAANGTDIWYTQTSMTPSFDVSGATVSAMTCPSGRAP